MSYKTRKKFKPHMMYGDNKSKKANTYEEHLDLQKKGWGHTKKYEKGGLMKGPSHKHGGIPIEVEGGEIVINKTENNAAGKHEKDLLALNKNPNDFEIIRKTDARKRSTRIS